MLIEIKAESEAKDRRRRRILFPRNQDMITEQHSLPDNLRAAFRSGHV
jgi:hypothetical protein